MLDDGSARSKQHADDTVSKEKPEAGHSAEPPISLHPRMRHAMRRVLVGAPQHSCEVLRIALYKLAMTARANSSVFALPP